MGRDEWDIDTYMFNFTCRNGWQQEHIELRSSKVRVILYTTCIRAKFQNDGRFRCDVADARMQLLG